jgi:methyl-accepting chemotaxis protein
METAAAASEASLETSSDANALLTQVLEQTNALRGFVIKGDPKFYTTYKEAKISLSSALARMEARSTEADQKARLQKLREAVTDWQLKIGDKVVDLMANGGQAEAQNLIGVKSLTSIRAIHKDIYGAAEDGAKANKAQRDRAVDQAGVSIALGGLIAVVVALFLGWLLTNAIAKPVEAMTDAMRRLAKGDNTVVIPAIGRRDEVGAMADAVQSFKDAAIEKASLETEAHAARAAADDQRRNNEAAQAATAREVADVVAQVGEGLAKLSAGDLTYRLAKALPLQYTKLGEDFNSAVNTLQKTITVIDGAANSISAGSGEITQASDDLSRRTEQQAANLEQTAAALDQITATVGKAAEGAVQARQVVSAAKSDAEHSSVVVGQAITAMDRIEKSAQEIGNIIGVIDEIAFQTNLLALNAGVEAARAGDSGRGFAVVASEVRALAQRSAEAAKEIKALIASSRTHVEAGVGLVGETGQALQRIAAQITQISGAIHDISISAKEQATALAEVNTAVNQMDQVTQQNAAMVEQATAASHSLAREAESLSRLMGQFQVGATDGRGDRGRRVAA